MNNVPYEEMSKSELINRMRASSDEPMNICDWRRVRNTLVSEVRGGDSETHTCLWSFYAEEPYPSTPNDAADEPYYLEALISIRNFRLADGTGFVKLVK